MIYLYVINYDTSPYNIGGKLYLGYFDNNNSSIENRVLYFINQNYVSLSFLYKDGGKFCKLSVDNDSQIIDIYSYSLNEIKKIIIIMD